MLLHKPMLRLAALVAAHAVSLFAQTFTGAWQGSLQLPAPAKELRIVFKITTTDADSLKAVMYSIDQSPQPIPGNVTRQGGSLKIDIPGIGGVYDGKLDPSGNSISGTFAQGGKPIPLNLVKTTPETAWTIPEPPAKLKPMRADADPSFDVATIKPSRPDAQGHGFRVQNVDFSTLNTSLSDLIAFAYGLHPRQILGAPAWVESDKFDVAAKPDVPGQPNDKQLKLMVQKLLADRFKLTFHREKKELSVYAIVVAKTGPKLTKNETDPNGLPGLGFRRLGQLNSHNATIADLAGLFQSVVLDRPVVDQTGLSGRFDFALNWTPDEFQFTGMGVKPPPASEDPNAPPDLFKAIQDQLGLKLESTKAQTEVFVIDRVEKPGAN